MPTIRHAWNALESESELRRVLSLAPWKPGLGPAKPVIREVSQSRKGQTRADDQTNTERDRPGAPHGAPGARRALLCRRRARRRRGEPVAGPGAGLHGTGGRADQRLARVPNAPVRRAVRTGGLRGAGLRRGRGEVRVELLRTRNHLLPHGVDLCLPARPAVPQRERQRQHGHVRAALPGRLQDLLRPRHLRFRRAVPRAVPRQGALLRRRQGHLRERQQVPPGLPQRADVLRRRAGLRREQQMQARVRGLGSLLQGRVRLRHRQQVPSRVRVRELLRLWADLRRKPALLPEMHRQRPLLQAGLRVRHRQQVPPGVPPGIGLLVRRRRRVRGRHGVPLGLRRGEQVLPQRVRVPRRELPPRVRRLGVHQRCRVRVRREVPRALRGFVLRGGGRLRAGRQVPCPLRGLQEVLQRRDPLRFQRHVRGELAQARRRRGARRGCRAAVAAFCAVAGEPRRTWIEDGRGQQAAAAQPSAASAERAPDRGLRMDREGVIQVRCVFRCGVKSSAMSKWKNQSRPRWGCRDQS